MFHDVVAAVATLHAKAVAHRDLKPANVLIHQKVIRLCDLGLCLTVTNADEMQRLTQPLERIGSVHYMPKEAFGPRPIDENQFAFDAYALGKILYELLAGRVLPGFESHLSPAFNLATLRKQPVYNGVNTILKGLLHDDPQRRLPVLRELIQEVSGLISWSEELAKVGSDADGELKKALGFASVSLASVVEIQQAAPADASKKAEVDALAAAVLEKWKEAPTTKLLQSDIVGRNAELLTMQLNAHTVLRDHLQGALTNTRRGIEPLTDRGFPQHPAEEAGCEVALIPTSAFKSKLPELRLCCLTSFKKSVALIGIVFLKRQPGENGAVDIVDGSEIILSGREFSSKLRHDCEAQAEVAIRKFADLTAKEFQALKPK